jgi:D-alanine transaminase
MSRIVFLNGLFLPYEEARLPVMDRGFLFADGVYEVSAVLDGKLVDNEAHLARLERSLGELGILPPYTRAEWAAFQTELISRNGLTEGVVYLQVTRGVAERAFTFAPDLVPTTVMFTQAMRLIDAPLAEAGADVITVPDIRWQRRDIKSTGLLAQVLAKQQALQAGAAEAFMVEDGFVTEGASSSVFVLTKGGEILTRPLSNAILPGITRQAVMRLAAEEGLTIVERVFTVAEALEGAEVFYTSASSFVIPVVRIDGAAVADGKPGRFATMLRAVYIEMARHL